MYISTFNRAKAHGIPYTIKKEDIPLPTVCPLLGVKLDHESGGLGAGIRPANRSSLDRIIPAKGYVLGNIQTISDLANRIKTNATPEQLLAFSRNMLRLYGTPDEQKQYANGGQPYTF